MIQAKNKDGAKSQRRASFSRALFPSSGVERKGTSPLSVNGRKRGSAAPAKAVAVEVPLGCFILDRDGRVTCANGSGLGLLRRQRLVGRGSLRLSAGVHPADRRRFRAFLHAAIRGGAPEPEEFWLHPRRSVPRCMQLVAASHPDGCTVVALDVTSRKAGELSLGRRNEELARQVTEAEEQLRLGLAAVGRRTEPLRRPRDVVRQRHLLARPGGEHVRVAEEGAAGGGHRAVLLARGHRGRGAADRLRTGGERGRARPVPRGRIVPRQACRL